MFFYSRRRIRLAVDMKFPIHIHIHRFAVDILRYIHIIRRLTCIHAAPNFCKIQQCKSVYSPSEKHDTNIFHFKLLKNK